MSGPILRAPGCCAWAILWLLAFGCAHSPHRSVVPRRGTPDAGRRPSGEGAAANGRCSLTADEGSHESSGLRLKLRGRFVPVGRAWKVRVELLVFSSNGSERVFMSILNIVMEVRSLKPEPALLRSFSGALGGSAQGRTSRGLQPATWRVRYPFEARDKPLQPGQSVRFRLAIRERYGKQGEWERYHRVGWLVAAVPRGGCPTITVQMERRPPLRP